MEERCGSTGSICVGKTINGGRMQASTERQSGEVNRVKGSSSRIIERKNKHGAGGITILCKFEGDSEKALS